MQAGLIPLVGRESGVDIDPDFGMVRRRDRSRRSRRRCGALAARPPAELAAMAAPACAVARATYTRENYRAAFGAAIERILAEHEREHTGPGFAGFVRMPGSHHRDIGRRRTLRAG